MQMMLAVETCAGDVSHQTAVMRCQPPAVGRRTTTSSAVTGRRNRGRCSVVARWRSWRRHSASVATCRASNGGGWRRRCSWARRRSRFGFRTGATSGSASPTWRQWPHRQRTVWRPRRQNTRPGPHTVSHRHRQQNTRRGTAAQRSCRRDLAMQFLWFQHSPTLPAITVAICRYQSQYPRAATFSPSSVPSCLSLANTAAVWLTYSPMWSCWTLKHTNTAFNMAAVLPNHQGYRSFLIYVKQSINKSVRRLLRRRQHEKRTKYT